MLLRQKSGKKKINDNDWLTYKGAGANTSKEDIAVERLIKLAKTTFSFRKNIGKPLVDIGHFAAIVNLGMDNSLAIKTDGVGTKIFIAQMMEKYDTIGIDCVAMNVNDIICVGAENTYTQIDTPQVRRICDLVLNKDSSNESKLITNLSVLDVKTSSNSPMWTNSERKGQNSRVSVKSKLKL